jgi:hypothetical protein
MYVNVKMIPIETVPGMGGVKENNGGGDSIMIYLIYSKNFCKCQYVQPSRTTMKMRIKEYHIRQRT